MSGAGESADPRGYYRILELEPGASMAAIHAAWRRLAYEHHPDRGGDAAHFQRLQEAYETLSDPVRRMAYDGGGMAPEEPPPAPGRPSARPRRRARRRARTVGLVLGLGGLLVVALAAAVRLLPGLEGMWPQPGRTTPAGPADAIAETPPPSTAAAGRADHEQPPATPAEPARLERLAAPPLTAPSAEMTASPPAGPTPAAVPEVPPSPPLYEVVLRFRPGGWRLQEMEGVQPETVFEGLATALAPVAGRRWWVELEASSPRAVRDGRAAVDDWELALLRLAAVLEALTREQIPPERLGAVLRTGAVAGLGELGVVRLRLYCCRAGGERVSGARVETATGDSTPRSR